MTVPALLAEFVPDPAEPDAVYEAFVLWAQRDGLTLYPAQEEALLEIVGDAHVILSTPTGSGKSMVALGAQFAALSRGQRSFYTAPIKALVSEKFFALIAAVRRRQRRHDDRRRDRQRRRAGDLLHRRDPGEPRAARGSGRPTSGSS